METNLEIFSKDFMVALSSWQNGWREIQVRRQDLADELVKQCKNLPEKFRTVKSPCFRKCFIVEGEIVPILLDDNYFEGIASWSTDLNYTKNFKGLVRPGTRFAMVFKCNPRSEEIVVNISDLWKDQKFREAAHKFNKEFPDKTKAMFNFQDKQSEIVLRSTLKGSEIENVVGISSSFEKICDMAGIPE